MISSRGCSRGFILCVLWRAWEYVRKMHYFGNQITFPFPDEIISDWVNNAIEDCRKNDFSVFGGTAFNATNASTFWTKTSQFLLWYAYIRTIFTCSWIEISYRCKLWYDRWKNNVERKSKFRLLVKDTHPVSLNNAKALER